MHVLTRMAICLFITPITFAGTMGTAACQGLPLTISCEEKHWDLGVQALYLQPVVGPERTLAMGALDGASAFHNKWGWGFLLDGSYHFSTGNDLNLNWTHYDVSTQGGAYLGTTPLGTATFTPNRVNRFDQVNLLIGQQVTVSPKTKTHFVAGLQYAGIRSDLTGFYSITTDELDAGITAITQYNQAEYNGLGPVIGADYAYSLGRGWHATVAGAFSVLYGTGRNNSEFFYGPNNITGTSSYSSTHLVVPAMDLAFGLKFEVATHAGLLNVLGGYRTINYFNSLVSVTSSGTYQANFGLYGPYFGFNWLGNA